LKSCWDLEILFTRLQSSSDSSSSINYSNPSFEDGNHQYHSNDHQVLEYAFIADGKLHILKAENRKSGYELKQFDWINDLIGNFYVQIID
jgi:hypothetical protein